ncbi:hypothetical protein B0A55_07744 [Friedmanniomyces simplex]|uniref:Uncharacterized protein n=1 Tax=Friedmanniomyces simplex TaxID=329884 RepID=A0A4U0XDN3_9PEZI|nr:hypothetical protein B0A55_07744 [Friedmanniomyces simplex]
MPTQCSPLRPLLGLTRRKVVINNAGISHQSLANELTPTPTAPTFTFTGTDGEKYTAVQTGGHVIVDSTVTISQGVASSVRGVGGISVGHTAIIVSQDQTATTIGFADPGDAASATQAAFSTNAQTYTAIPSGTAAAVFDNGDTTFTLYQGAATQLGSRTVSVGTAVGVDSETLACSLSAATPVASQSAVFTDGGRTYTVLQASGSLPAVIQGDDTTVTVYPGAAETVNGQAVTIDPASSVVFGSQTIGPSALPTTQPTKQAVVTVGGSTISFSGPTVTLNGETVSLRHDGLVAGSGSTQTATFTSPAATPSALVEVVAVFTLSSRNRTVYEVASSSGIVEFEGMRLFVGGSAVTADGHTISVAPSGMMDDGTLIRWTTTTISGAASEMSELQASSLAQPRFDFYVNGGSHYDGH